MACCKRKDIHQCYWLVWTLLLNSCLGYLYYELENCKSVNCAVEHFRPDDTEPSTSQPFASHAPFTPLRNDTCRIAVCLVGGARAFELTGRTIRRYLLDVYNNTDVFLHSPLDQDSHKFTLLAGRNLRVARIFTPQPIPETNITAEVLTAAGSPSGTQGLLQYFKLVEGCFDMVRRYEILNKFRYDWIIRTRVDGYWNAPLPDLRTLDPKFYYVAAGNEFGGLNDRFGVGSFNTSQAANARLSMLPAIHARGYRQRNSEGAYKAQLELLNVEYQRIQVPFCVMSINRMYPFPPGSDGILILSMAGKGPMSGTYCRPCDREANATYSRQIADSCKKDSNWPGASEVTVCDARGPWTGNWREIAQEAYRRNMDGEAITNFRSRPLEQCIKELEDFQMQWDVWDSPAAETICRRAFSEIIPAAQRAC